MSERHRKAARAGWSGSPYTFAGTADTVTIDPEIDTVKERIVKQLVDAGHRSLVPDYSRMYQHEGQTFIPLVPAPKPAYRTVFRWCHVLEGWYPNGVAGPRR